MTRKVSAGGNVFPGGDYDVLALRQALWDIFRIAGGDTDGNGPAG